MNSQEIFRINSPDVIYENVDNEVLIIEFNTGNYYSLDSTGAEIWELLAAGIPVGDIIKALENKYKDGDGDINKAITALIDELQQENLISPGKEMQSADDRQIQSILKTIENTGLDFVTPSLQKYSDMQELLLLDPIHEVDETGWPAPKKE